MEAFVKQENVNLLTARFHDFSHFEWNMAKKKYQLKMVHKGWQKDFLGTPICLGTKYECHCSSLKYFLFLKHEASRFGFIVPPLDELTLTDSEAKKMINTANRLKTEKKRLKKKKKTISYCCPSPNTLTKVSSFQ